MWTLELIDKVNKLMFRYRNDIARRWSLVLKEPLVETAGVCKIILENNQEQIKINKYINRHCCKKKIGLD